jgi:hypothetical protein
MAKRQRPGGGIWRRSDRLVTEGRGPAAVQVTYLDTLNRCVRPDQGHILSLSE